MKNYLLSIALILLLFAVVACGNGNPAAEVSTSTPTEIPAKAPTQAPTETSTPLLATSTLEPTVETGATIEEYVNSAFAHLERGDYEQAIEDYNKAIELDPDFAEAYYLRGVAYYVFDDPEQAIEDFTKAIELDPNFASGLPFSGACCRLQRS